MCTGNKRAQILLVWFDGVLQFAHYHINTRRFRGLVPVVPGAFATIFKFQSCGRRCANCCVVRSPRPTKLARSARYKMTTSPLLLALCLRKISDSRARGITILHHLGLLRLFDIAPGDTDRFTEPRARDRKRPQFIVLNSISYR